MASLDPPYQVNHGYPDMEAYQTIAFHPSYQRMSLEELRLKDYREGFGRPTGEPQTAADNMTARSAAASNSSFQLASIRASPDQHHKLDDDPIFFLVGTDPPKKFAVHEGVVKPRSEFVRLALRGEWKEATERIIPLPDDEPAVFKVYQQWLYSGLIHTREPKTDSDFDEEYQLLAKAYILGEKILDIDFKDCLADALVEKLDPVERFDPHVTNLIFDNTPSGSPLRRLWLDIHCRLGKPEWLFHITNVEFLVEFGRLQMKNRTSFDGWSKSAMFSKCTYHGHGANPCYRGNPA